MSFKLYFTFFCCFIYLSISNIAYSQIFEHAEIISGLGVLEENNGVAVADYDGDFDLDIFVVAKAVEEEDNSKTFSRLFRNNNDGSFSDVTQASGIINLLTSEDNTEVTFAQDGHKFGVSWGDYNNDGFPDLFFTYALKVQLFRNLGDGTFLDITATSGFNTVNECINTGATWFDYNNDGNLDIYISDWDACNSNSLYINNGNETFTNVTEQIGLLEQEASASYTAIPFDFDMDGWMDIYVSNDFDDPNYLYINQTGISFTEQSQSYGVDSMFDDMGVAVGDYNNDGFFDFFITAIDKNILLTNNGDNTFLDLSLEQNVGNTGWAWGTRFADFDLDGDEDLFVVNGYEFEDRNKENNTYFKNLHIEGQSTFEDNSNQVGLGDLTISVEAVDFDYDNDGDLDIYVTNNDAPSYFYENKLLNFDDTSTLNWFKIALQGTVSNRDAIGTKLELTYGTETLVRYYSGVGFFGQSLQPVHFGLNNQTNVSNLTITWPSGIIESYQNLNSNTFIKATEGQGMEVLDVEPSQKIYGCTDPDSCTYNPQATLDDGSCEYLSSNQISGNTNTGFLRVEAYTYPLASNSTATWSVEGGDILEGQGTNTLKVRWNIEESGTVSVRETSSECSSLETTLEIEINISEIDTDTSIARIWNEVLLEAIRGDFARPTVHARNLFHMSVAMYDAWAIYDDNAMPYFIGNEVHDFSSELQDFIPIESKEESQIKAMSYAAYRLLTHRFQNSPSADKTQARLDLVMEQLGYDTQFATNTNYEFGSSSALGNYIAQTLINYGMSDGAREMSLYDNEYYEPFNQPLVPDTSGNPNINNPNRWQPLSLDGFVDQSGNLITGSVIDFLSPEWGNVFPFALEDDDKTIYQRDGHSFSVYNDPSDPPYLADANDASDEAYKWGFSLVSVWASHLDPNDGITVDISPKSIGNIPFEALPTFYTQHPEFYDIINGGDIGVGYELNPTTGLAYQEQLVPRGDYTRVLAEFWADGPDSETPPGHWYTILNYVSDNELLEKRFAGEGELLESLEWDVKAYFILGGAMHDAAISAWSVKGWYDYIRPISAIRYMADKGQSSDENLPNFHIHGIPLIGGYIELVNDNDPLAGDQGQHVDKIKLFTWKGPGFINDTSSDIAGVGWILAENWWPYQRPNFVTPPFAGYVSGHSTYSRAAAEVLTRITGDEFFPGGLGEFVAEQNKFLVFEQGPSVDIKLQWATYRDASDQCSLSRIWGGIHPPADDIPGRLIGEKVGIDAYNFAVPYFNSVTNRIEQNNVAIYPNPIINRELFISNINNKEVLAFDIHGRQIQFVNKDYSEAARKMRLEFHQNTASGVYIIKIGDLSKMVIIRD